MTTHSRTEAATRPESDGDRLRAAADFLDLGDRAFGVLAAQRGTANPVTGDEVQRDLRRIAGRLDVLDSQVRPIEAAMRVAYRGPCDTDAAMMLGAADRLERGFPVGGSNVTAAVVRVLRAAAHYAAASPTGEAEREQVISCFRDDTVTVVSTSRGDVHSVEEYDALGESDESNPGRSS